MSAEESQLLASEAALPASTSALSQAALSQAALSQAALSQAALSQAALSQALNDPRVSTALEQYLEALEAGQKPNRQAFLARHADIAEALADCLDGMEILHGAGSSPQQPAHESESARATEWAPGTPVGDFRIVREIGRGGMGVVYEAEQLSLGRRIALKVLPFAWTLEPRQLQRFKNEARAVAHLHHQHIVPIYGVGCERGIHFYAMQFILGQSLAEVIRELRKTAGSEMASSKSSTVSARPKKGVDAPEASPPEKPSEPAAVTVTATAGTLSTAYSTDGRLFFRTVAQLGVEAAEALEHAHSYGVVHRDIKPGNLLVDVRGHVWVTDFGLAQIQSDAALTRTGDVLGTLRYMSPEQALARRGLDHRTDIYSLGATLYELATLEPVYSGSDREELLRQITLEEPRSLRQIRKDIPAELETIVCKALEKAPDDRYATAQELADDLRRFLEDKPLRARPVTLRHRANKWARRHPAVVWSTAIASLLTGVVLLGSAIAIKQVHDLSALERDQVEAEARTRLELHHYYKTIALVERERAAHNAGQAEQLLDQCPRSLRGWEWNYLKRQRYGNPPPLRHTSHLFSMAVSPDGKRIAAAGTDGTVQLWDAHARRKTLTLPAHNNQVRALAFSADGRLLASAGWDHVAKVWDTETGRCLHNLPHDDQVFGVAFSLDGTRLASTSQAEVIFWELAGERRLYVLRGHKNVVRRVVFSPDGGRVASCDDDAVVKIWDAATGALIFSFSRERYQTFDLAFSPDGRLLASAGGRFYMQGDFGEVRVWDAASGVERHRFRTDTGAFYAVAFSPDSARLVVGGEDPTVRLWDLRNGLEALSLRGHTEAVWGAAFAADGKQIFTAGGDHRVRIWDARPLAEGGVLELLTLDGHTDRVTALAFHPDGQSLASAGLDRTVRIWNARTGRLERTLARQSGPIHSLSFSTKHHRLAAGLWLAGDGTRTDRLIKVWDSTTWTEVADFSVDRVGVLSLSYHGGGRYLAAAVDHSVKVWSVADGLPIWSVANQSLVTGAAFAGRDLVVSVDADGAVKLRSVADGTPVRTIPAHAGRAMCVAAAPDGRRLATAGVDGAVRIWDVATGKEVVATAGHPGGAYHVAFSPDGKRLASAGNDALVRIWDTASGKQLAALRGHTDTVWAVAFSPDGRRLASGGRDRIVRVWDVSPEANLEQRD